MQLGSTRIQEGKTRLNRPENPAEDPQLCLVIVLITFVSGILFCTFVMDNINFATETFNTQMAGLLLNSFTMNSNHIVAFLKNTGFALIEITSAYINGIVTTITKLVKIAPNAIGSVILTGNLIAGHN